MRTIIIGAVAAGMSAATRLRRLDESREILVFEKGDYVSYANCGLPYYVGGVIQDRNSLLLQTPESLANRFNIVVKTKHQVVSIDAKNQEVGVKNLISNEIFSVSYDELVLVTGATTSKAQDAHPAIKTYNLRTVNDVDNITNIIKSLPKPATALVIGGGFIGLEAVENLVKRGIDTILVHRGKQLFSALDMEMAYLVYEALVKAGVKIHLNTTLEKPADINSKIINLSNGQKVSPDFIIDASGVYPDTKLAQLAGIKIGNTGGIVVDENHRTNIANIYAAGDAVEKIDHISNEPTLVTMAGLANRHGRAVADVIAGVKSFQTKPSLGTSILGVFDLTVAFTGWNEKRLRESGREFRILHVHPNSHATYYPGATQMALKLLIDAQNDQILGAQIVGGAGVDKRIDVIATAMSANMSASSLSQLELSYAPQYGSAKDAINIVGYAAENLANKITKNIQWHELDTYLEKGFKLVDVRSQSEHSKGSIPGALNIPLDELRSRHLELPDAPLIVHCQVGQRAHTAAMLLQNLGYDVSNLDGGWLSWSAGNSAAKLANTH